MVKVISQQCTHQEEVPINNGLNINRDCFPPTTKKSRGGQWLALVQPLGLALRAPGPMRPSSSLRSGFSSHTCYFIVAAQLLQHQTSCLVFQTGRRRKLCLPPAMLLPYQDRLPQTLTLLPPRILHWLTLWHTVTSRSEGNWEVECPPVWSPKYREREGRKRVGKGVVTPSVVKGPTPWTRNVSLDLSSRPP